MTATDEQAARAWLTSTTVWVNGDSARHWLCVVLAALDEVRELNRQLSERVAQSKPLIKRSER